MKDYIFEKLKTTYLVGLMSTYNCKQEQIWSKILMYYCIYLHVMHEQGMVGSGWDYPDFDTVLGIPV